MNIEQLERDMRGQRVTTGLIKATIVGEYLNLGESGIELWKKKDGTVKVKWCAHCEKMDAHERRRKKGSVWVWDYGTLSKADQRRLIDWLEGRINDDMSDV